MNYEEPVANRSYVLVGVSESPAVRAAVLVAAREAATRHVACRVRTVDPDGFVFSGSTPQVVAPV